MIQRGFILALCFVLAACGFSPAPALDPFSGSGGASHFVTDAMGPANLAVIVNDNDAQSVEVARYYQAKRKIPDANMIHVSFTSAIDILSAAEFATVKAQVDAQLTSDIQVQALTWTRPFRVDCMSVTSAFAMGYDTKYCSTCGATAPSGYFNTATHRPFTALGIRPAMMLAGGTPSDVLALIDRGVASDGTHPEGRAYLLRTTDVARSARYSSMQALASIWPSSTGVTVNYRDNSAGTGLDYITNQDDVMFYETGLSTVPELTNNTFLPGALGDHMTNFGGLVPASSEMSAIKFLEAGATGSYGTVVDPCGFTDKFPNPVSLIPHYYMGDTAVEAYWKSVVTPGEGLFIGEPLARPYADSVTITASGIDIQTNGLTPTIPYQLEGAMDPAGPFTAIQHDIVAPNFQTSFIDSDLQGYLYFRLTPQ